MIIKSGTVVRIVMDDYGYVTRLVDDISCDETQYIPEVRTLYISHIPQLERSEFDVYIHTGANGTVVYPVHVEDSKHVVVNAIIVSDDIFDPTDIRQNGLLGVVIFAGCPLMAPMRDGYEASPIVEISDAFVSDPITGICMIGSEAWTDEAVDEAIRLFDYGYILPSHICNRDAALISHARFRELAMRFPFVFDGYGHVYHMYTSIKQSANNMLHHNDISSLEDLNRQFYSCDPFISWIYYPSGYANYGRNTGYSWVHKLTTINIPVCTQYRRILDYMTSTCFNESLGIHRTIPKQSPVFISTENGVNITYTLPSHIQSMLARINHSDTKVVVAGGFVIMRNGYDFFTIGDDRDDTIMSILDILNPSSISVNGHILSFKVNRTSYRIICTTDAKSVDDILYSFSLSHLMIAHDGSHYHATPEFLTFTAAGMSMIYSSNVFREQLRAAVNIGFVLCHTHSRLSTGEYLEVSEPTIHLDRHQAIATIEPCDLRRLPAPFLDEGCVLKVLDGRDITGNIRNSQYIDANYNNMEWFQIDPCKKYEVLTNKVGLVLHIRQIWHE